MADLPSPNTDTEVYLAAVVERLDRLLRLLDPPRDEQPKPAARKRVPSKKTGA